MSCEYLFKWPFLLTQLCSLKHGKDQMIIDYIKGKGTETNFKKHKLILILKKIQGKCKKHSVKT